jgi:hypothetical protein
VNSALTERDKRLNRIVSSMELVHSYSITAAQFAWRGDEDGLKKELAALRLCVLEAFKTFKELDK